MPKQACIIGAAVALAWWPSMCGAQESAATCGDCHSRQGAQLSASVHGALACQECHGGEETYAVPPARVEELTAGRLGPGSEFDHGPSFTGKPQRRDVPAVCGECHADIERMNPYGLRTDQLARYKTSGHGKALYGRQDERVAVCSDCHGSPHAILAADHPQSRTHPLNVPDMCGTCHEDHALMEDYDLAVEVVGEYRDSVHGRLLLEQHDTGAPTCASCHGNHSAMPPGFATVGAVCGQCHRQDAEHFAASIHGELEDFEGCVPCHGGGEGTHFHLIQRITKPVGLMTARYADLLSTEETPTPERITEAIHPEPKRIMARAVASCLECHDELDEDENLPKLFATLDQIAGAERRYVQTAKRLDDVGRGVLLVESARFKFGDAKTHLIALGPLQHRLDDSSVAERVAELHAICDEVNQDLDELEAGLSLRYRLLVPIWAVALIFSVMLYVKYRKCKAVWVKPAGPPIESAPRAEGGRPEAPSRRTFLDWLIGSCSAAVGGAMGLPAVLYLWPAAKGDGAASVEVAGAANLPVGQSTLVQVGGKAVIVVRHQSGFKAFSAACTHLGCLVKWDAAGRRFLCPCHAAVFDENGGVVSGPPPSALPEYKITEAGDQVFVSTT